jgi:arylsulfatase
MTYPHRAAGWALVLDTPSTRTKRVDSGRGGTKVGTAAHRPEGITAKGELQTQCHQLIDVAPTVREAAGSPNPRVVIGAQQYRMGDMSMVYSFADAKAKGPLMDRTG